jgi:hypothetical protein
LLQIGCMFIQVEFVIFCYTPRKSIIILLFTSLKMVITHISISWYQNSIHYMWLFNFVEPIVNNKFYSAYFTCRYKWIWGFYIISRGMIMTMVLREEARFVWNYFVFVLMWWYCLKDIMWLVLILAFGCWMVVLTNDMLLCICWTIVLT